MAAPLRDLSLVKGNRPMIEAGSIVGGKYRLVSLVAQGGMGSVWRAEHIDIGSVVAIKLIDPSMTASAEVLARFKREAKTAATLKSMHVVQIFDYGVEDQNPYIVMEFLDGESLGEALDRGVRLRATEILRILSHASYALDRAHAAGIVHRDMKPDNIFLTEGDDGQIIAKVLDFGVAKANVGHLNGESILKTRTGAVLGTPAYMSPEQLANPKDSDHRADIWALGAIVFECMTGFRPFWRDSLPALILQICTEPLPIPSSVASVPLGFDQWFAKACARSPDDRFRTTREMVEAFRAIVDLDQTLGPCASTSVASPDWHSLASNTVPTAEATEQDSPQPVHGPELLSNPLGDDASAHQASYVSAPHRVGNDAPRAATPDIDHLPRPSPSHPKSNAGVIIGAATGALGLVSSLVAVVTVFTREPPSSLQPQIVTVTVPASAEQGLALGQAPETADPSSFPLEPPQTSQPQTTEADTPDAGNDTTSPASKPTATKTGDSAGARPGSPDTSGASKAQVPTATTQPLDQKPLPEKPWPSAIQSAMGSVREKARACVAGQTEPTQAMITLVSSGAIKSISISGGAAGTPAAACVRDALMPARVGPFKQETYRFNYTIRP